MDEHSVVQWIKENRIIFTSPLPVVIRLRINTIGLFQPFPSLLILKANAYISLSKVCSNLAVNYLTPLSFGYRLHYIDR